MIPLRTLLRLLPALLVTLLFAAAPGAAEQWPPADVAYAANDSSVQPPKQADHSSRRPRHTASLEEFFEIDDDAEQYWKPLPVLFRNTIGRSLEPPAGQASPPYRDTRPAYRACAEYQTGPPHA